MMTSSNEAIFRVAGHLCGDFTGLRWIPRTKASDAELWCFLLICVWINGWVNNRRAGDLRRHHAHYDVTIMICIMRIFSLGAELFIMTLWLENIYRITGPLWGKSTGYRLIPLIEGQWCLALMFLNILTFLMWFILLGIVKVPTFLRGTHWEQSFSTFIITFSLFCCRNSNIFTHWIEFLSCNRLQSAHLSTQPYHN